MTIKLLCFDMDGVIFQPRNFWLELHRVFGTLEEGKKLTEKYLHTDYDKLVQEVVARLWKGKDAQAYYQLVKSIPYMKGVKELFKEIKKEDWITALISSGSIDLARRAQHDLGIDHIFANELVIKNNRVTGEFIWPIGSGGEKKAQIVFDLCKDLGIKLNEVVYIGDSDMDIDAFKIVGISIAFNCSDEKVMKAAKYVVRGSDLRK